MLNLIQHEAFFLGLPIQSITGDAALHHRCYSLVAQVLQPSNTGVTALQHR